MHDTAFIVGIIDTDTGKFLGCGLFSEETPTLGRHYVFTIACGRGRDYQEGIANLRKMYFDPRYPVEWWIKFLDERSKKDLS